MLTVILVTVALNWLCFAAGMIAMRWWLSRRTPEEAKSGAKRCGICQAELHSKALRTADGHWRCREHKGRA